ncbi:MAG: hypothetical protein WC279_10445 [Sulfurimonas sp.]|jgi:DNA-directed RNA polymerase beta subunit|uniref:hypothetical protein n=1 Tax=Sulfurimonas sp. TaxID=2022749 RepID=UPI00356889AA
MIDFGKADNKSFNDLAAKLVAKVLKDNFRLQNPSTPEHSYTLENIKVSQPDDSPMAYMKTKILGGKMLMRVYGDIVEVDADGQKVGTVEKKVMLGSIPFRTGMGTYLLGNDYNGVTQPRNNPSVYTTMSEGGAVQSAFQLGKGHAFKITVSDSGSLRIKAGDAVFPLIPLLKIMGMSEQDIESAIGAKLWDKNRSYDEQGFYEKMNTAFFYKDEEFRNMRNSDKDKKIRDYFEKNTYVDPETTMMLTGVNTDRVDKELFDAAIRKLVAVYRKEDPGDDRWDLRTSKLLTTSHLFADRLQKQLPRITYGMTNGLKKKDMKTLATNMITKTMEETLLTSDLSRLDPQYNLMGAVLTGKTITPVGEGAISDTSMVEKRGRQFHPTQTGIFDLTFSPQGMGIGLSLRAAPGLTIDDDGTPGLKLRNTKTGKVKSYKLTEAAELYIKLPGEKTSGEVDAYHNYKQVRVPASKCTHEFADPLFADSMQMVPFPSGMQGPRGIMAVTQFAQAVPLVKREAPRVVGKGVGGQAADKVLGAEYLDRLGLNAPLSGTIVSVNPKKIVIKTEGGQRRVIETESVVPLQYNTGIRIEPKPGLKAGDKIRKGDPLFVTNMHTDKGELAPGVHLKTMWAVDPDGYGVEDGIVISRSAAENELVSEHFYRIEIEPNPGESLDYKRVKTLYRHKYTPEQMKNLDETTGVIKPGSIVKHGDVIACLITERDPSEMDAVLGRLSRSVGHEYMDSSRVWDKFHEGEVTAVETSGRKTVVIIATKEEAEVGTKLTGRFGNKGVVSRILDDEQMPIDRDSGERIQLIMSPASVPGRVNPVQIEEAALGETGKKYVTDHFEQGRSTHKRTVQELLKAGKKGSGKASVFNPITGMTNEMGVGKHYVLKLFSPEKSISARGVSGSYDSNLQPVKGGKEGSKALGLMEFYGLLGHNSKNLLKEFGTIKSEKNLDFWRNYEMGIANMPKTTPYTFGKFNAIMTAAGAQISRTPEGIAITPVTDSETAKLSQGRKIQEGGTYKGTSMETVKGGLFDPRITGGRKGELWSEYELSDGIPHPMLNDIIRVMIDVPKDEWRTYVTTHSGDDMKKALNGLDLDSVEARLRQRIADGKEVTTSTQTLRFVINLRKLTGKKPGDFIIKKIPVVPPRFRPLTVMPDGTKTVNDLNYLYQDVITSDKLMRSSSKLPKTRMEARDNVVAAVNAFVGLEEPRSKTLQEKGVRGALTYITGKTSPKEGFFLNKMMKKQMINTGRARIIPDPTANMDEVGIPAHIAWNTYEPHLRKKLRGIGYKADQVTDLIARRDPVAKRVLDQVLKEEYILVNRAPSLHSFSILAGKPKMVDGNFISIPTAFEAPLNADYDGDEVTVHAPVTAKGKQDAEHMLLSNRPFTGYSPFNLTTGLDAESIAGLYKKSVEDERGFLAWWKANMPGDVEPRLPMTKKNVKKILSDMAVKHKGQEYGRMAMDLNRIGFRWASELGLTVSMDDIKPLAGVRGIVDEYRAKIKKNPGDESALMGELQDRMLSMVQDSGVKSSFSDMLRSQAKGNAVQVSAIIASPAVFIDPRTGEPSLIEGNTSDGYSAGNFLKMNAKARDEMIKTKMSVAGPGDLYKQMAFNTRQAAITEEDCGTSNGIEVDVKSNDFNTDDLIGRLLSRDLGSYKKDTAITPDNLSDFLGFDVVPVRSPITCETERGLCAKCYGVDDEGHLPPLGDHVNVRAVNSYSLAITQKSLDAKHSGRTLVGEVSRKNLFEATKDLLTGSDTKISVPVAEKGGTVIRVVQEEDKGYTMWVGSKKYSIAYPLEPLFKEGDTVDVGDILASGANPNTKDIANSLGHGYARKLFTDAMHNNIFVPNGITPHSRNVELLAKELYKYVEVLRDYKGLLPGDIMTLGEAAPYLKEISTDIAVDSLKSGMRLGGNAGEFLALDIVSDSMIAALKKVGVQHVPVITTEGIFRPVAKGMTSLPLLDGREWLDTMGFRFLKRNLTQALTSGHVQKVDPSTAPLTSYVTNIWD